MTGRWARRATATVAVSVLVAAATGCGSSGGGSGGDLTVFAAASLTETFQTLEKEYEREHRDVDVVLSFGSSSTLAEQIAAGAPADVIATADRRSIDTVAEAGLLDGSPIRFAGNSLVVVTPADNPADIRDPSDLQRVDYVACDPSAPCGAAAEQVLADVGVTNRPRSLEPDVKSVLSRVVLGEADAGLVYVTDARAAGDDVRTVAVPRADNVINPYFVGVVDDTREAAAARDWVTLMTSPAGRRVLADAGFEVPP